ncbi:ABC transporter ATP-binding protein [Roseiarcus sp.]|uniref:ABC transporter ATP-binding protein n=1 Tax=Roseiarcus sp. TaxID=1969460 RepID=UPI003F9C8869
MFWRTIRDRIESMLLGQSNATLRRLLSDQGAKHWKGYAFSFAMMGLIALTTSLSAWIIGRIVDKIFVAHKLSAVWEITAAIITIYVVKGLATYGQQVSLSRVANSIVADVQTRIFDQMLRMKVEYYSRSHSSEFIARQAFIAQSASNVLNLLITTLSRDALTIVGLVVVMVSQDPLLSLLALMFVPVAALGVRKIGLRVRRIMASEFQGAMQMMESLQETAQGVRIVKAFTLEDFMRKRQGAAIRGFQTAANKLVSVSSRTSPIMESLGGFAIAAVVLYSGYSVILRGNPPGSLFSFITSVIMLYEPMKRVARFHVDLSSSLFGVNMLYDFLDAREFEEDPPGAGELTITEGRIEFRDVVFGYRPEERVLHAVSFVAQAGKTTALVGRSGGGKSTVMSLILRLYDIESGQILCDGVDISSVTRESVRRQIGYVAQENFLFKGSVRDNIAMGRPGATDEEIVAAAKAAYAHDFIMGFDRGYGTPCGEHGMQLSGGQRQRIAIARAFLKDAPVILLDEATSALDSESEQAIQKALHTLCEGRTTIVIAHRLSTVAQADEICVIDRGRIVERGRHRDLLAQGHTYSLIAKTQFPRDAA